MSEASLKLASERLDELAKKKTSLEDYLKDLKERQNSSFSITDQAKFVETNLRDLLKGWAKSTNSQRKRLLRRAIKRIVITAEEMKVVFWLSAIERDGVLSNGAPVDKNGDGKIIPFRGLSHPSRDRNLLTESSHISKNGSGGGT